MNYKDLRIWQSSFNLSIEILKITKKFPKDERFNLVSQLNRAAISIPSNIAEGHGRGSQRDFHRFCSIAKGSANEVETQVLIANQMGYINAAESTHLIHQIESVLRQLIAFQKTLK